MDEIIFKVASVADISLFVAKIIFIVAEIIIKEHVITSSIAKSTYIVAEITLQVVVVTYSLAKITFVVDETTFKVAMITFFQWLRKLLNWLCLLRWPRSFLKCPRAL